MCCYPQIIYISYDFTVLKFLSYFIYLLFIVVNVICCFFLHLLWEKTTGGMALFTSGGALLLTVLLKSSKIVKISAEVLILQPYGAIIFKIEIVWSFAMSQIDTGSIDIIDTEICHSCKTGLF